jgi:hypothetical protein
VNSLFHAGPTARAEFQLDLQAVSHPVGPI